MSHNARPGRRTHPGRSSSTKTLELLLSHEESEAVDAVIDDDRFAGSFDAAAVDSVLDAYLDEHGRLTPAPVGHLVAGDPTDPNHAHRLARGRMLDALRANAWASGTLANYGGAVAAWRAWCQDEGVPALPFDPLLVANHLTEYAFQWEDGELVLDEEGRPVAAVTAGTVAMRLAGLNKCAEFIGIPKPGDNPGVAELMRGIRAELLTAPEHKKRPLDLRAITKCLAAAEGRRFTAARDRAATLLRARTEATAGQLARLKWADITLLDKAVVVELAPAHRHGKPREVRVKVHPNQTLCLLRALRNLRVLSSRLNHVLAHADGEPMTRQALHLLVAKSSAQVGGWDGLPTATDRSLAPLFEENLSATPLAVARDRAVLLTGFWCAARRSNISKLNWRDLEDRGEKGIKVYIRTSKTDREGKGATNWIPMARPGSQVPCPATAVREWRAQVAAALGREPRPDEPVFASFSGRGTLLTSPKTGRLQRLGGEAINHLVQRLAVAAGLAKEPKDGERLPYGAHSLRHGFATEAARAGLSISELQAVTHHKSVTVLMGYIETANDEDHNGATKLLNNLLRKD